MQLDQAGRIRWLESLSPQKHDLKETLHEALLQSRPLGLEALSALAAQHLAGESNPHRVGDRIGPYLLTKELGHGGMAQVWLAQRADGAYQRQVALKLPMLQNQRLDLASRFVRERDILASLEHPSIARLYDAGVSSEGLPYLAMEYVAGKALVDWCDARKLQVEERLRNAC
jgi:serine/threonine protein kinase